MQEVNLDRLSTAMKKAEDFIEKKDKEIEKLRKLNKKNYDQYKYQKQMREKAEEKVDTYKVMRSNLADKYIDDIEQKDIEIRKLKSMIWAIISGITVTIILQINL